MASDGRIVDYEHYGQHIPLTCIHHPDKRWSTKNIAPLGCRSIFYNLDMQLDMGPECECSGRDLRPLTEEEAIEQLEENERATAELRKEMDDAHHR